MHMMHKAFVDI